MRALLGFLTRDWLTKVLALTLAVVIFLVVDKKITGEHTAWFTIRFGPSDAETREDTIFIALKSGLTATLDMRDATRVRGGRIEVRFTGPRERIGGIRGQTHLVGKLRIDRTLRDEKTLEDVWTIPGSQIHFYPVDPDKVHIDIPDLQIRVLRLETRHVNVAADLDWFRAREGYRKGDPVPDRPTVKVTCPRKYFNFDTVPLKPADAEEKGSEDRRRLVKEVSRRRFTVVRPREVPPGVMFVTDPTEMEVNIPLVPVNEKLDIEVPIVLRVPTDGVLGPAIPRTDKIRESFTFIGPPNLLKYFKDREGTDEEIQAVIDLSRIGNERIAELKAEGIHVKPMFFYPTEDGAKRIRCEHPKEIWVSLPAAKGK